MPISKYHRLAMVKPDEEIELEEKREDKIEIIIEQAGKYIVKKIIKKPTDIRLVCHIATLIENSIWKKYGFDKLQIFIDVMKILFPSIEEHELKKILKI